MDEFAARGVGGTERVSAPGPVGPATRERVGYGSSGKPGVPGVGEFDRLELASVPNSPQVYAQFTVSQKTGMVSIKIMDARTGDLIREIPADEVIRMAEELQAYVEASRKRAGRL